MILSKHIALAIACCLPGMVLAQEGTTVLGQLIGGKIPAPRICTMAEVGIENPKSVCWLGKPFVAKDGSRMGHLQLTNQDKMPKWAAFASFSVHVSKASVLEKLTVTVKVDSSATKHEIATSITSRFGQPVVTTLNRSDMALADWTAHGIGVHLECVLDRCIASFSSADAMAKQAREHAELALKEAARPVAP